MDYLQSKSRDETALLKQFATSLELAVKAPATALLEKTTGLIETTIAKAGSTQSAREALKAADIALPHILLESQETVSDLVNVFIGYSDKIRTLITSIFFVEHLRLMGNHQVFIMLAIMLKELQK